MTGVFSGAEVASCGVDTMGVYCGHVEAGGVSIGGLDSAVLGFSGSRVSVGQPQCATLYSPLRKAECWLIATMSPASCSRYLLMTSRLGAS